jgi:hypothetical protein
VGVRRVGDTDRTIYTPHRGSLIRFAGGQPFERLGTPYGAKEDPGPSNEFFAKIFGARLAGKGAAANDNRPGFPHTAKVADLFMGCKVASTGEEPDTGSVPTPYDGVAVADLHARVRAKLSAEDARVLDLALTCQNFRQLGEALGKAGKTAERHGKARLLAAVKRLAVALKEIDP